MQEKNHLFTRTPAGRGLDGLFPPKDAETNPYYQAFIQTNMFENAGSIDTPSAEQIFRDSIYPPGSEDVKAPYKQRLVNSYRILQIHDDRPCCSSFFDEFSLDGGIADVGSLFLRQRNPTPAIHFYHSGFHYEGIIYVDSPRSKIYLRDKYTSSPARHILQLTKKNNPFLNGPIDLMIPCTGRYTLAPNIVVPSLSEIWISRREYDFTKKQVNLTLIQIDKDGIAETQMFNEEPARAGAFFRKEFNEIVESSRLF